MAGPGVNLIGQEEIDEVLEVLRSRHLSRYRRDDDPTFGAKVRQLELEVARLTNVKHALGVGASARRYLPPNRGQVPGRFCRRGLMASQVA